MPLCHLPSSPHSPSLCPPTAMVRRFYRRLSCESQSTMREETEKKRDFDRAVTIAAFGQFTVSILALFRCLLPNRNIHTHIASRGVQTPKRTTLQCDRILGVNITVAPTTTSSNRRMCVQMVDSVGMFFCSDAEPKHSSSQHICACISPRAKHHHQQLICANF